MKKKNFLLIIKNRILKNIFYNKLFFSKNYKIIFNKLLFIYYNNCIYFK